ncbi:ORF6N domain-containing protein [Sphingobacterium chuzhouense]|uniref:ORF6N domain-containing protein n=1 Tax=Sphingobacterium chuzhouense TaxID=1742264 RepID=UPI00293BD63B|nr:ORF6N domain-containing protein [Sphingobacterium chuzhouense]
MCKKPFRLREEVRRNIEKFPEHFMYELTEEEVEIMVSQNVIPSRQHYGRNWRSIEIHRKLLSPN